MIETLHWPVNGWWNALDSATHYASMPMYDRPETRAANDRLWQLTRHALGFGPAALSRPNDDLTAHWMHPDLVLSQTCSLPFRTALKGQVQLVGTPVYDLPVLPGAYFSVIVARMLDAPIEAARVAINGPESQSGWAALWEFYQSLGTRPGRIFQTGAHARSAKAVADGVADIAAIDAQTWALIKRYDRFSDSLVELAQTPPTPALPFICGRNVDAGKVQNALKWAIAELDEADRRSLRFLGLVEALETDYTTLPVPADPVTLDIPLQILANG
ncbi:MAG: PhnD/SsuA/transferrin family substrate-binding protein [Pseudomonadota bacterium]